MIENIICENETLAIIVRNEYQDEGIHFLTPGDYSQQLAYMHHPKGKSIDAHIHNEVQRNILFTQEVLVIKKGQLRVDFYNKDKLYYKSSVLKEGDLILLVSGGHGFQVLDDIEMIEIKQGPYAGDRDKIRFNAISEEEIKF